MTATKPDDRTISQDLRQNHARMDKWMGAINSRSVEAASHNPDWGDQDPKGEMIYPPGLNNGLDIWREQ